MCYPLGYGLGLGNAPEGPEGRRASGALPLGLDFDFKEDDGKMTLVLFPSFSVPKRGEKL